MIQLKTSKNIHIKKYLNNHPKTIDKNVQHKQQNNYEYDEGNYLWNTIQEYDNMHQDQQQKQSNLYDKCFPKKIRDIHKQIIPMKNDDCALLSTSLNRLNETNLQKLLISKIMANSSHKKHINPIKMFKDQIDLEAENKQKQKKYADLWAANLQLKTTYHDSYLKNCQIQKFLKIIQFTFKNDQALQRKANQTLLKAKNNLQREQKQSKAYFNRISKIPKNRYIKELKAYFDVQNAQKQIVISSISTLQQTRNKILQQADLNSYQEHTFSILQQKLTQILQQQLQTLQKQQQMYKKQKFTIKIHIINKQIYNIRREIGSIEHRIRKKLLEKQGIEYQIQILQNRTKERNKKQAIQIQKKLLLQVNKKKTHIMQLQKQMREKCKTNQYICKWTKQLRLQLQQLRDNHTVIKQQYQRNINKLSKQIEEWNRKYKAELVEDQVYNKTRNSSHAGNTGISSGINSSNINININSNINNCNKIRTNNSNAQINKIAANSNSKSNSNSNKNIGNSSKLGQNRLPQKSTSKIALSKNKMNRLNNIAPIKSLESSIPSVNHYKMSAINNKNSHITIDDVNQIRKILIFYILQNGRYQNHKAFIDAEILKKCQNLSYEQLLHNFMVIAPLKNRNDISKLIRYILEDPNSDTSPKQALSKVITSQLCQLILKNLLASELNASNLVECRNNLQQFFNKHYDTFRQDLWQSSGKTINFSIRILQGVFKKYVPQQKMIILFVEYFQFKLWKKFQSIFVHKLVYFQMICEDILKKKLMKDPKKRISNLEHIK